MNLFLLNRQDKISMNILPIDGSEIQNTQLKTSASSNCKNYLVKLWNERDVDLHYREIVFHYFQILDKKQVEKQMNEQIRKTLSGQAIYFSITKNDQKRIIIIHQIEQMLSNQSNNTSQKFEQSQKIQKIRQLCNHLHELREVNLNLCENIFSFLISYGSYVNKMLVAYCGDKFNQIDSSLRFLRQTRLKNYIFFQEGYDPFFLSHYQQIQSKKNHHLLYNSDIQKLFQLNIGYSCRMMKIRTQILIFLTENYQYDNQQIYRNKKKQDQSNKKIQLQNQQTKVNFRKKIISVHKIKKDEQYSPKKFSLPKQSSFFHLQNQTKQFQNRSFTEVDTQNQKLKLNQKNIKDKIKKRHSLIHRQKMIFQEKKSTQKQSNKQSIVNFNLKLKLKPLKKQSKIKLPEKNIESEQCSKKQTSDLDSYRYSTKQSECWIRPVCIFTEQQHKTIDINKYKQLPKKQSKESQIPLINANKFKNNEDLNSQNKQSSFSNNQLEDSKRQIKVKPVKFNFNELIRYLKKLNTELEFKKNTIQTSQLENKLKINQTYAYQLYIRQQLTAFCLIQVTSSCNYAILLWVKIDKLSLQDSVMLLKKFIVYLQKSTSASQIQYSGHYIEEIKLVNFQKRNSIYFKNRSLPLKHQSNQLDKFLSLKWSNITLQQKDKNFDYFSSEQIEAFNSSNSYINTHICKINTGKLSYDIKILSKITEQIENVSILNQILQDQFLDNYEINYSTNIKDINLFRIAMNSSFENSFVVDSGCFKFQGEQIYQKQNQKVFKLKCNSYNLDLYFAKGFKNILKFINFRQNQNVPCFFSVKMFNKQFYGRLHDAQNKQNNLGCYANCQFSLFWQDQLQGRVKHSMNDCQSFGSDSFYIGIALASQFLMAFQVKQQDFLF